ncbi:MAG: hypothetical protein JWO82_3224 [Akkermansiaceae bacterium]|nr:hypothetical protein [Akkermansiaceae bacterium]
MLQFLIAPGPYAPFMSRVMIRKTALFLFAAALPAAAADFKITPGEGSAKVECDGALVTEYRTDSRVPYCYPLMSPSGADLTRHWPMETGVKDEETDHPHHRSFWLSHGSVNGSDYWAWTTKADDPKIVHQGFQDVTADSFTVNLSWQARGKTDLTEKRTYHFARPDPQTTVIDVTSRLTAADGDVVFGDTKEGFFAIRMDRTLRLKGPVAKGHIIDSAGRTDQDVWGKRTDWVAFSGPDEKNQPAVVAMLDHPANPSHPTWWHARDYGLLAANPFGRHDFEGSKDPHLGEQLLKKGETLVFRYEVVLHLGDLPSADLTGKWTAFSKNP